jgi:hypothetical protein
MTTICFIDYTSDLLQEDFMSKNSFDRIMDWPYHPQMIMTTAYIFCFTACMQNGAPIWAELIAVAVAVAIVTPFAALLLFLPYLITIVVLAALFSLPQAILQAPRLYKQP